MKQIIRLYRSITARDCDNDYCLTSMYTEPMTKDRAIEEIVSHVLNASTRRGILYSFSTDLHCVKEYSRRHSENSQICYIDIDFEIIHPTIVGIYPVYLRDYLMNFIADCPKCLESGMVINPATMRSHSILGIINVSQRTVSGWAHSMREVILQCNQLKLNILTEKEELFRQDESTVEAILRKNFLENLDQDTIERFRHFIHDSFDTAKLKRTYILDRVNGAAWY